MKKSILFSFVLLLLSSAGALAQKYEPTPENLASRAEFTSHRLGIFLHWGIYSSYAQGEWYLSIGNLSPEAYSEAATGFYPSEFDPAQWARAFKEAGAGYVTMTSRHHDGFSMFRTKASPFNIVDATPYGRDVAGELTAAVKAEGMRMQFYYSIIDWIRPDYPKGNSGIRKDPSKYDYDHYLQFEKAQIKELIEQYHPAALWFDGLWDHSSDWEVSKWRMDEMYSYIHSLDPACLIGNNHHISPLEGEDFQMFEKDLPGENTTGFGGQSISVLPLEMCETMNDVWGYSVADQNYKSVKTLIQLLVRAAAKDSNLLLNIGPQANGKLPEKALDRLRGMGEWMRKYSFTVDGTTKTGLPEQPWGVSTRTDNEIYLHILSPDSLPSNGKEGAIVIPFTGKVSDVVLLTNGEKLPFTLGKDGFLRVNVPVTGFEEIDTILKVNLKK